MVTLQGCSRTCGLCRQDLIEKLRSERRQATPVLEGTN
jgi:hypothetical protein